MAGYSCNMYWQCGDLEEEDVPGWSQLMDGNIIGAVFVMFNSALVGWFVVILFFVFQLVLYLKSRNATLCWATGTFFTVLYAASVFVHALSVYIIFAILVFELAGILFVAFKTR